MRSHNHSVHYFQTVGHASWRGGGEHFVSMSIEIVKLKNNYVEGKVSLVINYHHVMKKYGVLKV